MKPDYNLCDRCKQPTKLETISVWTGRDTDPVGNLENERTSVDLCGSCCYDAVKQRLTCRDFPFDQANHFIAWVRRGIAV